MKNRSTIKLYKLLALIVVVFTSVSCGDNFFNEQAGERITPENHYKSSKDVDISLDGALIPLQNVIPKLIMLDGLRSDMMDVTPNADAYLKAINDQSFTLDNPYIDASDYYKVIINVNEVLANIGKVTLLDRNFDAFDLFYTRGALIGLRGWAYLNIVRLYGEAALIKDNLATLPLNLKQTILTKNDMIDTLINQIKPYIHDNTVVEMEELRVPHYPNTKALLGELYLEKNDYANAVTYLKMACESYGNLPEMLKADRTYTKDAWAKIFVGSEYGSSENISTIPFSSNEGQVNPLPKWMLYSDMYMVKPAKALIDSFKTQIPTLGEIGDLYRGSGITYDTTATGQPFIKKYALDQGEPYSTDIILSRASDIHLMLAEALNRMGDPKTAMILVNDGFNAELVKPAPFFKWSNNLGIRGRVLLNPKIVPDSINGEPFQGIALTEYVEDLIMNERKLELAFEGKRWFDLVRVAKRRSPDYLANQVASKFSDPAKANAIRIFLKNEINWYLPYKK